MLAPKTLHKVTTQPFVQNKGFAFISATQKLSFPYEGPDVQKQF